MKKLQILTEAGRDLVKSHDRFPQDEDADPPMDDLQSHVTTIEVSDDMYLDFDRLRSAINAAIAVFDVGRRGEQTAMDSNLAPIVRECLDVPTRVAAEPGFWWHTTLFRYPDFVRTRWSGGNVNVQEKFLGTQKDLYSNHVARLWWGAELTRNDETGSYFATHRLFNKQRQVNYLLDSSFRRYRPAARAFARELWQETGENVDDVAKAFNDSLSTIQLEARSEDELRDQLSTIQNLVT